MNPHTKTSALAVEDHEELKHEYASPVLDRPFVLEVPLTARDANRFREVLAAALKSSLAKQEPDPRTRFHDQFRKEVDEYDRDFHKKSHDDLNTTLIFVSRF